MFAISIYKMAIRISALEIREKAGGEEMSSDGLWDELLDSHNKLEKENQKLKQKIAELEKELSENRIIISEWERLAVVEEGG